MEIFNFEEDRKINFDQLELECDEQPSLLYKYSKEEKRLQKEVSNRHETVKITKSRLVKDFLNTAAEAGNKKPTGTEIESYYRTHPDHIDAKKNLIDAQYDLGIIETGRWSIWQRGQMLENIVKLLKMNYFSRTSKANGFRANDNTVTQESRRAVNRRRKRTDKVKE